MNLRIAEFRKAAHLTQNEAAKRIGVSAKTLWNWEKGETIPDSEQLWNCATALDCTPNDLLGWYETHPQETALEDTYEKELIGCYRASTTARKGRILDTARDAAGMSKEAAEPAVSEPAGREAM
ncbi:helix-turn-helix domain-containing protein [Eggerthella guodeyinii]|uniref:Helix-turn-helix domain-containing protein n=1 Tax=Eggerthella guodeyinii TaxID=2690837 RepID=A0A6N7RLL7_9ACTN|nr:helix-turn-helix transcriptional regulator [Eggerthella guodeyinii]MRX82225.1 helix-turn-helix domain-containing protein [Eggerthella guodeyinii]